MALIKKTELTIKISNLKYLLTSIKTCISTDKVEVRTQILLRHLL